MDPEPAGTKYTRRFYLALSAYCLGQAVVWGALGLGVQRRVEQLVPAGRVGTYLGLCAGAGALVSGVVLVVAGALSDQHRGALGRRRPFILAGALLAVPGLWGFALAGSYLGLLLSVLWLQFSVNVASGPYHALIPDLVRQSRYGEASAYQGLAQLLGSAAGPLLTGLLIAGLSVGPVHLTEAQGTAALAGIVSVVYLSAAGATVLGLREARFPGTTERFGAALARSFQYDLRSHPSFAWLIASRFLITMGFVTATSFLLYYVQFALEQPSDRAVRLTTALLVLATLAGLLGTFPAGRLADRRSKKSVIYVSAGLCVAAGLAFSVSPSFRWAFPSALLFGLGWGAFATVDWALACELVPQEEAARYMGVWGFALTLPAVVGPMLAGPLADLVNAHGPAWAGAGPGYRLVMLLSVLYFAVGVLAVRHIRERREELGMGDE